MHPILQRLKERKIVQWALAYLAGAVALYSALDAFAEPWGVGSLQLRMAQLLLLVGFFVALTLAWYHGERGEQRVSGMELLILTGIMGLGAIGVQLLAPDEPARRSPPGVAFRTELPGLAPNHVNEGSFRLGPQGTGVVYQPQGLGGATIGRWYRPWNASEGLPIEGTEEGLRGYDLSPEGTHLASVKRGTNTLTVQPIAGGAPRQLSDSVLGPVEWEPDGFIYFASLDSTVHRVPESGGREEHLLDHEPGDELYVRFLPVDDGRRGVLGANNWGIWGVDLTDHTRVFIAEGNYPLLLLQDRVLYQTRDNRLVLGHLDLDSWEFRGPPETVAEGLAGDGSYRLSDDGTLAYWQGGDQIKEFVWVDRSGFAQPVRDGWTFSDVNVANGGFSLSPDGQKIAFRQREQGEADIYVQDLADAGPPYRVTRYQGDDRRPTWSRDGRYLHFLSPRASDNPRDWDLWRVRADGSGDPELFYDHPVGLAEAAVSLNGRHVFVRTADPASRAFAGRDIYMRDLSEGTTLPIAIGPSMDNQIALSPDGNWLAYTTRADPSAEPRVVVQEIRGGSVGEPRAVSDGSGFGPRWSPDGTRLSYQDGERNLVETSLEFTPALRVTGTERLFDASGYRPNQPVVTTDGRFLWTRRVPSRLVLIIGWLQELKSQLEASGAR